MVLFAVLVAFFLTTWSFYKTHHVTNTNRPLSVADCRSSESCVSKPAATSRVDDVSVDSSSLRKLESKSVQQQPLLLAESRQQRISNMATSTDDLRYVDGSIEQRTVLSTSHDNLIPPLTGKPSAVMTAPVAGDDRNLVKLNCTLLDSCTPTLLRSDGFIRNCISGNIIGKVPLHVKTVPVRLQKLKVVESAPARQRSFKKVFDTRAWGHSWDAQYRGLNASGLSSIVRLRR
jgi:hypothetical protein